MRSKFTINFNFMNLTNQIRDLYERPKNPDEEEKMVPEATG